MLTATLITVATAQKPNSVTPRQERLLNGLKVLAWSDKTVDQVTLKLRIHSGSAFDPKDREGVMQLVADSFFPNSAAREYFAEELGGSLEVVSNYDYIQINASSRGPAFLTMLETIASAISNSLLDKDTTTALKAALITRVKDLEKNPAYIADQAAAKRLFGDFPYGRPQMGSSESIQKIDFADLKFAKDRLFTADNATIAISGSVDNSLALRAVRRYFGSWLKADKKIPSTFKQPDAPESKPLIINTLSPDAPMQLRLAIRGVAKNDLEYPMFEVLARILEERIKRRLALPGEGDAFVRNEAHVLPGQVIVGGTNSKSGIKVIVSGSDGVDNSASFIAQLLSTDIGNDEFVSAKTRVIDEWSRRNAADAWLDFDTFKIDRAQGTLFGIEKIALADVQRGAGKIKNQPVATVWYFSQPST